MSDNGFRFNRTSNSRFQRHPGRISRLGHRSSMRCRSLRCCWRGAKEHAFLHPRSSRNARSQHGRRSLIFALLERILEHPRAFAAIAVEFHANLVRLDLLPIQRLNSAPGSLGSYNCHGPRPTRPRIFVAEGGESEVASRFGMHFVAALGDISERSKYSSYLGEGDERIEAGDDNLARRPRAARRPRVEGIRLEIIRGEA